MDTVFLRQVRAEAIIGVHDWERVRPRTVLLDVEMAADVGRAATSDRIDDALDYAAVTARLRSLAADSRFRLLESLAEHLAGHIRSELGVPWVRLTVHKPGAVPGVGDVGVTVERGERP